MEIAEHDRYILNQQCFVEAVQDHLTLSFTAALLIGLAICIPLGILCAKKQKGRRSGDELCQFPARDSQPGDSWSSFCRFSGPALPALVALTILACPPILINTYLGFRGIDPAMPSKRLRAWAWMSVRFCERWKSRWPCRW